MWTLHKLETNKRSRPSSASLPNAEPLSPRPKSKSEPQEPAPTLGPSLKEGGGWKEGSDSKEGAEGGVTGLGRPWPEFTDEEVDKFPAVGKRNFWCIQRHQARALHYDLRIQLDGGTLSWAVPKGLLGISKNGESSRLAVQTEIHPISYTLHEGSDGSLNPSGKRCGTMLWDVGTYTIDRPGDEEDSDSEDERRRKRRRLAGQGGSEEEDPIGRHEEDKLREAWTKIKQGSRLRSFHFTLKGGVKMTNHSFILILLADNPLSTGYLSGGRKKDSWIIRLPKGVEGYSWGKGGEEGDESGRSVKTGRTFKEVCSARPERAKLWQTELSMFAGWGEDVDELAKK
ncbi:hypothetical protein JCM24511_01161 [Saitozyma sp. JCM 24511]|nr:hypothetical protein JCM24511_01161 [Saitozyma sp. JCM 24511]